MYSATTEDNVSSLKNNAQNLRTSASDAASDVKDDLRATANKAGRKVRELVDTASDEFTHARDTVTNQIRTKPVQSSVIALAVGYVLASLLRR